MDESDDTKIPKRGDDDYVHPFGDGQTMSENDGTMGPGGKLFKKNKKNPPGPRVGDDKHGSMSNLNGKKQLGGSQGGNGNLTPGKKGKAFVRSPERSPEIIAKRQKATQLRYAGFTYDKIGEVLKMDRSDAYRLVMDAIADIRDQTRETASELRAIAHGRIEHMLNRMWMVAVPTKPVYNPVTQKEELPPPDMHAIGAISRLMDQDARMMGYNAPEKHTVDTSHLNSQVSIIIEMITHAIPDESRERVFQAVDEAMKVIESREKAEVPQLGPGVVIDV